MWKKLLITLVILLILAGAGTYFYARSIIQKGKFDPSMSSLSNLAKKDFGDDTKVKINWDAFNKGSSNASLKQGEEVISVDDAKEALGIKKDAEEKIKAKKKEIKTVAVFGVDAFEGGGRSDSIIIVSIDPTNKEIRLHSILRDSYVNIPGHGMDKINHAYAYGGPLLAIRTINENFDLNITDYLTVSFDSLPNVIDYLGGVRVSISDAEAGVLGLSPGYQYISGSQALAYSRIRYIDSDIQRSGRQREVAMGLMEELLNTPIGEIPSTAGEIMSLTITNLNPDEVISLGTKAVIGKYEIVQSLSPESFSGDMINGVYYNVFDIEGEKENVHRLIYGE